MKNNCLGLVSSSLTLFVAQFFNTGNVCAQTFASHLPQTPQGYEWQLIDDMSDEFNGHELDKTKWKDSISTWQGRPPSEFLPKNISVANGNLRVKTSTHPNPSEQWKMASAAVAGQHEATYGYFESRIKASRTRMSTTFWLHSDVNEDKNLGCGKTHGIEIDILEAIGGWYDESWTHVMHSNTHYKPTEKVDGACVGAKYLSKGVKKKTPFHLADDYHVFSSWWRNPNEVTFYFDGEEIGSVSLHHQQDPVAFNGPMSLRMVSETYDWQPKFVPPGKPPFPTEFELDDERINTAYYDYVRSYQLVAKANNLVVDGDFENPSDSQWRTVKGEVAFADEHGDSYTHNMGLSVRPKGEAKRIVEVQQGKKYQLSFYGKNKGEGSGVTVQLRDASGGHLAEAKVESDQYGHYSLPFVAKSKQVAIYLVNSSGVESVIDSVSVIKE